MHFDLFAPRVRVVAALLAVLGLAAAVRLAPWSDVFTPGEVRFGADGDPLYHLLQAERLASKGLAAVWFDPGLDHPNGAAVPWPPLFDALIAYPARLGASDGAPLRDSIERWGAILPAILGVLAVALTTAVAGACLGGAPWIEAALLLALLPAHVGFTVLGRPDQHALELPLLGALVWAAARIARGGGALPSLALAVGIALSFWNWPGSALYLAILAGFAATYHVLAPRGDAPAQRIPAFLGGGLLGGAVLIAASAAALGPPGALRQAGLSGITGLHAALAAGAALSVVSLAAARRLRPDAGALERIALATAALAVPAVLLAVLPWTREGMGHGLSMLRRGSPWYRGIGEFRPLLFSGLTSVSNELRDILRSYGLLLLSWPLAAVHLVRRYRTEPERRAPIVLLAVWSLAVLALGLARLRFALYLSMNAAILAAVAGREIAWTVRRFGGAASRARLTGAAAAAAALTLLLAPALPAALGPPCMPPGRYDAVVPAARLLPYLPTPPGRDGVLARWDVGHEVAYYSGRPVVASPFGVEAGLRSIDDEAAWIFAGDPIAAEGILARRRVGLVLVQDPLIDAWVLEPFRPAGAPRVTRESLDEMHDGKLHFEEQAYDLVASRLYFFDGRARPGSDRAPLEGFRLLAEVGPVVTFNGIASHMVKIFGPVEGARVRVTRARGRDVRASVVLTTNTGRVAFFGVRAPVDAAGRATLRLPYATGANGLVSASAWRVVSGERSAWISPREEEVVSGAIRDVELIEAVAGGSDPASVPRPLGASHLSGPGARSTRHGGSSL